MDETADGVEARPDADEQARAAGSRRWRSIWRMHFYAGMFAVPFIVLMALTGLVILYTQPIQDATDDGRTVARGAQVQSYDAQQAAAAAAFPDGSIISMTVPRDASHATVFGLDDGTAVGREVFVDPYTATVVGDAKTGGGIVGLSNRLHGFLNNEEITVPLPTVSALWDGAGVMRDYVVGDLVLELLGVWTMVLVATGLYLWWPRRSRAGGTARNGRRLLSLRWSKGGRARWRDLHGVAGVLALAGLALTLVSGMGWSTYWGPNFGALANEITPNRSVDAPASTLRTRGDLDRLGNQIPWNTGDRLIPASYASDDTSLPAPISLDMLVAVARTEGMKPGYSIYFPTNEPDEAGNTVYGSFTLSNSWPRKTGEAKDLFVDQFSGQTLDSLDVYGYGGVSRGMDVLVSTHMGTQLGIVSRIVMTAVCVLALWSVISALVMYLKRRRAGTLGLPRRPADVRLGRRLTGITVVLGVLFPQWAASALIVLGIDRFVIRRVGPLRRAFGQA